jgi:hypothetical protein
MNRPDHVLPRHLLPAAILLLSLAATAQAEPVVLNPSFESPVYTVAPEYASNNGGAITGWIVHDPTRTGLSQSSGVASNFAFGRAIPDGIQCAFLQAYSTSPGNAVTTLSQNIAGFNPGEPYEVIYDEQRRYDPGNFQNVNLQVRLGGQTVVPSQPILIPQVQPTFNRVVSQQFFAANPTNPLDFIATLNTTVDPRSNDAAALIDEVSIFPAAGDANHDGAVDLSDLLALARNYGSNHAAWKQGDFNADGSVGFDDLLALARRYGARAPDARVSAIAMSRRAAAASSADAPEPSCLCFVTITLIGAFCRRRQATGCQDKSSAVTDEGRRGAQHQ